MVKKAVVLSALMLCLLPALAQAQPQPQPQAQPQAQAQPASAALLAEGMVDSFRRNILLHELNPGKLSRPLAAAGHQLFFQNRLAAGRLVEILAEDAAACATFVERIEKVPEWREPDRLALGGTLLELTLRLSSNHPCVVAAQQVRTRLAATRARYNAELTAVLGARARGAPAERSQWQAYLAFLRERYAGQALVTEPERAAAVAPKEADATRARQGERDEWTDGGLPAKAVLLTFDDGPHPIHTPRILDILARHGIKVVFFQVGQNIGTLGADGVTLREPKIIERMLAEGHAVANHTDTHPLLTRLDELQLTDEIDRTEVLLSAATQGHRGRAALFRPPYGARNDLVLAEVAARGLRSVLWNIDSRDWADPLPQSVAHRVIEETAREGRGIVLFHDIHVRAVDALPTVIEELQKRGFRFARLEQGKLVVDP